MITKLSKVFGKEVYTTSGAKVGRIVDVAIDVNTRSVSDIFISNLDSAFQKKQGIEDKKGIIFSYSGIRNIQDIVLVSDMKSVFTETREEAAAAEEPVQTA
ncbi:MAG: PRC-barrel domain-containing protein [Candidatus Hydrothermarchaeales archaeon]